MQCRIQYILKSFTNSGPPEGVFISDITMYIIDIIVAHIFHSKWILIISDYKYFVLELIFTSLAGISTFLESMDFTLLAIHKRLNCYYNIYCKGVDYNSNQMELQRFYLLSC